MFSYLTLGLTQISIGFCLLSRKVRRWEHFCSHVLHHNNFCYLPCEICTIICLGKAETHKDVGQDKHLRSCLEEFPIPFYKRSGSDSDFYWNPDGNAYFILLALSFLIWRLTLMEQGGLKHEAEGHFLSKKGRMTYCGFCGEWSVGMKCMLLWTVYSKG